MKIAWLMLLAVAGCRPYGERLLQQLDGAGVVDLSYPLDERTPHWPGAAYRPFAARTIATLEKDGVYSRSYCTPEHLGTHVDAPNHFARGQGPVADIPLRQLYGPVFVLDITARAAKDPDAWLTREDVGLFEERIGRKIPPRAIVLLRTGWGAKVRDRAAYEGRDAAGKLRFPGYSPEAAILLVRERGVAALGVDTLSIDRGASTRFEVHHVVNGAGRYGLENLANLELVPETGALAIVAPIKIAGGTGGQARVLVFVPK